MIYEAFRYRWSSEKCQALMHQPLAPFTRRQQLNHRRKTRKHERKFTDADMRITSPLKECSHSPPKIVNGQTIFNGRKATLALHEAKYEPLIPILTGVCFPSKRPTRACNTNTTVYTLNSHDETFHLPVNQVNTPSRLQGCIAQSSQLSSPQFSRRHLSPQMKPSGCSILPMSL